jgi:hypothetical protein
LPKCDIHVAARGGQAPDLNIPSTMLALDGGSSAFVALRREDRALGFQPRAFLEVSAMR